MSDSKKKRKTATQSIIQGKSLTGKYCEMGNLATALMQVTGDKEKGITFIQNDNTEQFLSYEMILEKAVHRLGGLQAEGFKSGQFAMLLLEDSMEFIITFWACILGGIIPVPGSYPASAKVINTSLSKLHSIWNLLECPRMISDQSLVNSREEIESTLGVSGMQILESSSFDQTNQAGIITLADSHSPAFIQFSSGSTNLPKGTILTHDNLLANIEGIISSIQMSEEDRSLGWMPYHHDMGLIGFHLSTLVRGIHQFNMTPAKFVKRPTMWLDMISKHRITFTGCPNFGFRLLQGRVKEEQLKSWDLSSLRLLFNGAEPISVKTMREFMDRFAVSGLKASAMYPVYGMAEACLAVSFPTIGEEPVVHSVNREKLVSEMKIEKIAESDKLATLMADEGYPVTGMEIRIVNDEDGTVVPEGIVGEIQIRGRNVTSGYINNPEVTAKSFQDDWLKTGDTGFILNGRLTVAGRIKDIIFVNGQNFFAHDIEAVIEEVEGVEAGKVAICGWHDEREGKEKVGLFTTIRTQEKEIKPLYSRILRHVNEVMGIPIDYVSLVRSIPKTTSGKVQRFVLVESFKQGEFADKTYSAAELVWVEQTEEKLPVESQPEEHQSAEYQSEDPQPIQDKTNVPQGTYVETIRNIWATVLERPVATIPNDQSFLSLGGTSIKAIQILGLIEDELQLELTHDLLLKCRTVNEMDGYLVELINGSKQLPKEQKRLEQSVPTFQAQEHDEIAVVAAVCRFPDAASPEEFWNNLLHGKCSIGEVPSDRWNVDEFYSSAAEFGKTYCRSGAFLENPYAFDANLFNISEQEAKVMDPQQRIVLELVYELMERAGYSKQQMSGKKVGLFVGAGGNSYFEYHLNTLNRLNLQQFDSFASLTRERQESILDEWKHRFGITEVHTNILVDNIINMIAARASHEFNFKGPSMVIDTACSSSLVTLHMACDSIRRGECESAIAGGINLLLTPSSYVYFSNAGALSASGRSLVFDASADGFVPGEGGGLVMLKPLAKALADGDPVLAVLKASAINNDGHSIGVMAPNPDGQKEVIESLYVQHNIDPAGIQYVEAHGTGTKIGDPSEVRALDNAFSRWNLKKQSVAIGSVKSNIGHLLGAAGIASFIKVVMALANKTLPPHVHVSNPNPMIKFEKTPFYLLPEAKEWQVNDDSTRRAAINSFGFGGTNCHLVVEEAPVNAQLCIEHKSERPKHVLCVSAHTESALQQKVTDLASFLEEHHEYALGDVCYTENVARTALEHRCHFVAESMEDLVRKLRTTAPVATLAQFSPKLALMFTGQGSQYVGMGRELYSNLPAFRKHVDQCSEAFYPHLKLKITDLLYGEAADDQLLAQTNITQPVVFAIDYAFGKLLLELGVEPAYMLGHSVGEWVAACLAGAVSLSDAARLVALRGKLMSELQSDGAMAAVFTSGSALESLLQPFNDSLWIAGYNVTHQVVSGRSEAVDEFLVQMQQKGIRAKKLNVSQAFHTPLMNPMLDAFKQELEVTTFQAPAIPIISNVTAEVIDEPLTADYWMAHILGAVKFEQSIAYLFNKGIMTLVEAGPDFILAGMASGVMSQSKKQILSTLARKKDNWEVLLGTLGSLYSLGAKIKWKVLEQDFAYKKVLLPAYPFERSTYKPDFGDAALHTRSASVDNSRNWFYQWKWSEEESSNTSQFGMGAVIVCNGDASLGQELANKLNPIQNPVYFVNFGNQFAFDKEKSFTIRADHPDDYLALLEQVPEPIAAFIHAVNYGQDHVQIQALLTDSSIVCESSYSLVNLGKALVQRNLRNVRVMVVTNEAFSVSAEKESGNPHQSIAATLAQVIDHENEGIDAIVLDVDKAEYETTSRLAETVWHELKQPKHTESIVAIRGNSRYVRSLEKMSLSRQSQYDMLTDGGTYLITGGTGLIGSEIAKAFAKQASVNLVLTGRKQIPPANLIQQLEELGARVMYVSVDVTDRAQMETLVQKVKAAYGSIQGVVHAAGLMEYAPYKLLTKNLHEIEQVLTPKVQGTIITDLVTRQEPLQFFVTLSSVSASQKAWAARLGDYAAANSFLNGYSEYRAKSNAPGKTLSINYSLWDDTGAGTEYGDLYMLAVKSQGLKPLSHAGATDALMRALTFERETVVHILDLLETENKVAIPQTSEGQTAPQTHSHTFVPRSAKEIRNIVYQAIADQLRISVEDLEVGMNFLELGLDSVGATKVIAEIGKRLNTELYPTLVFEYQTPEALTGYIEQTLTANQQDIVIHSADSMNERENLREELQDIAIIGMGLRIPGANNLDEYWDLLKNGRCVIGEVAAGRWSRDEHVSMEVNSLHTTYSNRGGFIDAPYDFDPLFFGMSPKEAEVTDPQQRIFLQIAWEALQQAGYGGKHRTNKIGVFVGCEQNTYMEHFANYRSYQLIKNRLAKSLAFNSMNPAERQEILASITGVLEPSKLVPDVVAGNGLNEVAARVSHCLNLTGPSMIVNSACSSSLVALHLACESIRTGQSEMAIAGGVNLNLSPTPFVSLSRVTALSPTGTCYPFDKRANGMVLAEGASSVLLKPLKHAVRDGDTIYAVIKGSAINNDGRSQGITAPRPQGQAEVIRAAYLNANINPETVSYIETHGTATPLGDPIEIEGMTQAFSSFTTKENFCGIGSVKSSVGHMLSAAGVTSLIKVALALKHKTIPHTVNYEEPNPNIDFKHSPFYVVDKQPRSWKPEGDTPLRASVNAFGFGGTNAHVILEEAPEPLAAAPSSEDKQHPHVLFLTGRNEKGIQTVAQNLRKHVELHPELSVSSVSFTMNQSQKELSYKTAAIIRSHDHLLRVLASVENGLELPEVSKGRSNPNREMPIHLLLDDKVMSNQEVISALSSRFPTFGFAYREVQEELGTSDASHASVQGEAADQVDRFAIHYAIGNTLAECGVRPASILAEGMGILAAVVLAGIMTLKQAIQFIREGKDVPIEVPAGANEKAVWKCPVIIPSGMIDRNSRGNLSALISDALQQKLTEIDYRESFGKDEAVLYSGNQTELLDQLHVLAKKLQLVELTFGNNPVEAFLGVISKLYTIGVPVNPAALFPQEARRIPLPTYPFENATYKAPIEDEAMEFGSDGVPLPVLAGLKKIEV